MKMMLQFTMLILLLLSGTACGLSPQPQAEEAEASVASSPATSLPTIEVAPTPEIVASNQIVNEEVALLWEGDPLPDDELPECQSLIITVDNQAKIGPCGAAGTSKELLANQAREWSEILDRFAPFEDISGQERIILRGQGQLSSPAWPRAITAWARFTYLELASGRVSASIRTVMSWWLGEIAEQPGYCRQLVVLMYGYAYANVTPCQGGQVQETVGGWLDAAEMDQFDAWLYHRAPLFQDNNYLTGLGSTELSEAELAALNDWVAAVYARLLQSSITATRPLETVSAEANEAAACPEATATLKLLTQATHGYCLLYPVEYAYEQPNDHETVFYVGSLLDVEHPKVFIEVTEAGGQSAEQIAEALVAEVQQAMPGFQVERRAGLLIGGEPATQLDNMPGQDISRQVLVVHHGRLYKLTFIPADKTAGAVYQQMEDLYHTILDSFKFLGGGN